MSASNSEASGEINQPPIVAQPHKQPMWDNQGCLVGDLYAPAFIVVQKMNAIEAYQLDEEEEEEEDEKEPEEAHEEDKRENFEEQPEEEPIEDEEEEEPFKEEEEEEPFEIEEEELEEIEIGMRERRTKEEDDLLSDARTYYGEKRVARSKYDQLKNKYKRKLEEQLGEIE